MTIYLEKQKFILGSMSLTVKLLKHKLLKSISWLAEMRMIRCTAWKSKNKIEVKIIELLKYTN